MSYHASTWTPSFPRETSAIWLNSYAYPSMAIEKPLEPSWGEILPTDPVDHNSRMAILRWTKREFNIGGPNRDYGCEVYRHQYSGLGFTLAGTNASNIIVTGPIPTTYRAYGLRTKPNNIPLSHSFQPYGLAYKISAREWRMLSCTTTVCGCLQYQVGDRYVLQINNLYFMVRSNHPLHTVITVFIEVERSDLITLWFCSGIMKICRIT